MMEFYSDNELLSQIAEGDERAFSALYYRYDTMLYVFLMKLTRSEAAAEELLQETFLRLWLHRDKGLTPADIANQVGVTASTVRNTIAAAIRQIRERLLNEGYSLVLILFFLLLYSKGTL